MLLLGGITIRKPVESHAGIGRAIPPSWSSELWLRMASVPRGAHHLPNPHVHIPALYLDAFQKRSSTSFILHSEVIA